MCSDKAHSYIVSVVVSLLYWVQMMALDSDPSASPFEEEIILLDRQK